MQIVFKHDVGDCTMKGKRLPEVVVGEAKNVFKRAKVNLLKLLTTKQRRQLSSKQWLTISQDFEGGIALLWARLEVKWSYASKLPVLWAGMVHSDENIARKLGRGRETVR